MEDYMALSKQMVKRRPSSREEMGKNSSLELTSPQFMQKTSYDIIYPVFLNNNNPRLSFSPRGGQSNSQRFMKHADMRA